MASTSSGITINSLPIESLSVTNNISNNSNFNSNTNSRIRRGTRAPSRPIVEGEVRLGPNGGISIRGGGRNQSSGRGRGGGGRGGATVGGNGGGGMNGNNNRNQIESLATTSASTLDTIPPSSTNRPAQNQRPPSNRRGKFNSTLSSSTPLNSSSTPFTPPISVSSTPAPSSQTLLERLTTELSSASYDCCICFSTLSKSTSIHSCNTCYSVFHLKCIGEWANRSCLESSQRLNLLNTSPNPADGTWRCPSCQTISNYSQIPKVYTCFCGKVKNPVFKAGSTPHSCGKQCSRKRPIGCKHVDSLLCHPGPCPPCLILLKEKCHCEKKDLSLKCSSLYTGKKLEEDFLSRENLLKCGKVCGKSLDCGLHFCQKECHGGDCGDCAVPREKICYCSRTKVTEECGLGERERINCFKPGQESSWEGEFQCETICNAPYDCETHFCEKECHPHSSSSALPCPLSPSVLTHCPCTQTSLSILLSTPRKTCLDSIPTCKKLCPKLLSCGHSCGKQCHLGDCGSCETVVGVVCRCGSQKSQNRCGEIDYSQTILCEKVCRSMRNCGRHECNKKCCELSWQEALKSRSNGKGNRNRRALDGLDGVDVFSIENDPQGIHQCDRVCGRKLSCGIHLCAEKDHKGPCRTCLMADFSEMICHCGSTIILPPIACNTVMDCRHPCIRPSNCGHPQMSHACHEDEACPACPFLTAKSCACGKKSIVNQRCSSKNVSCGLPCGKLLRCSFHRCRKLCHTGECEEDTQICLKPLRLCSHPCPLTCHSPSSCSTEKQCQFSIEISCLCGHLTQKAKCLSTTGEIGTEEGNRERKLKCTDSCLLAKRNLALAEALGIEKKDRKVREVEYVPTTMSYYSDHPVWCTALETTLTEFLNGEKTALHLPVMKRVQRQFTHEMAEAFELRAESMDEEPKRSMLITRQSNSSIPTPTLLEAFTARKPSSSTLNLSSLKRVPDKVVASNAFLLEKVGGYEEHSLKELLKPFLRGMNFSVLWITEEDVIVLPILPSLTSTLTPILPSLSHLQETSQFCNSVDLVHYSTIDGTITRGGLWTPVYNNSGSNSGSVTPRNGNGKSWGGKNSFAALQGNLEENAIVEKSIEKPIAESGSDLLAELRAIAANIEKGEAEPEDVPEDWEQTI